MKRRPVDFSTTAVADAELQADVMRFVAILALCLVAISTLVDGNRADPVPDVPTEASIPPSPESGTSASPEATPDKLPAPGGADRFPLPAPADIRQHSSTRLADGQDEPPPEPGPRPAQTPGGEDGFSLRFATDAALLRMAARGDARIFVLSGGLTLALDLSDGVDFRPSDPPASYYSMSPETVPGRLRQAYRGTGTAVWGVTLPERTATEIDGYLHRAGSGVLVIDASGRVSLESDDD